MALLLGIFMIQCGQYYKSEVAGGVFMELQKGTITLRSAVKTDAKQLATWWNDGAVMAHAGFPNGLDTNEEEVISQLCEGLMVIEESNRLIGECSYRDKNGGIAEIGIKICEPDCQNRGIGRVVLSMLIRYLFEHGFDKIILDTNLMNIRAQRVYESLGFRKLRVNYDSWTDQLGNKQSSVDYELVELDFTDYATNECINSNL